MPSDESEREWVYDIGDLVARENTTPMPGTDSALVSRTEYEVLRRLVDSDSGEALYYLEYEDGSNIKNQLYVEDVLRLNFEKVGEVNDE